jgi:hypothetical protein
MNSSLKTGKKPESEQPFKRGIHKKIRDLFRSYERKNIPYEHFIDVVHQWHQNRE